MKNRIKLLPILLLGLIAPLARAQQLPVLTAQMTEIDTIDPVTGINTPAFGANANAGAFGPSHATDSGLALNGGSEPVGTQLLIWALAKGTAPVSGFTYSFYVNGIFIGNAVQPSPADYRVNLGIAWTPPQPGVYFLSCTVADGLGHTAPYTRRGTDLEILALRLLHRKPPRLMISYSMNALRPRSPQY